MSQINPKRSAAVYTIVAWMMVNAVFMALEVTVFNDAADLNNSILLILWLISIVGLISLRKIGVAITLFTFIYAFSFNAFNVIYYPQVIVLNGASAILNTVAIVYMFRSIFQNRYK